MRSLALFISVLFHPLLMVTYACLLLFYGISDTVYDNLTPFETKWRISLIVFMLSFVFPVLIIFIFYRLKRIPAITLSNQRDRTLPYIMTALLYLYLSYLLFDSNIWNSIKLFIAGSSLAILLTALINIKFKISAHMVGIGGLLGFLISVACLIRFDMALFYIAVILSAGAIGFARLKLEEHRPYQIYTGFLLGFIIQTGLFFALQKVTFA